MTWVRTEKAKFCKIDGSIWDDGSPLLFSFRPTFSFSSVHVFGKMQDLFGDPTYTKDETGFREYHIEGRKKWARQGIKFIVQEVKNEYKVALMADVRKLGLPDSTVKISSYFPNQKIPIELELIFTEFCILIQSHNKMKDYESYFLKYPKIKLGVKNGRAYITALSHNSTLGLNGVTEGNYLHYVNDFLYKYGHEEVDEDEG